MTVGPNPGTEPSMAKVGWTVQGAFYGRNGHATRESSPSLCRAAAQSNLPIHCLWGAGDRADQNLFPGPAWAFYPPVSPRALPLILLGSALLFPGCATYIRHGLDPERARQVERSCVRRDFALSPKIEQAIMALDPEHVTEADIRGVLSQAPAPRIINIHGGVYPVHRQMIAFSTFLMGMGYPRASIANPGDGT
jgi:hypothetical protein